MEPYKDRCDHCRAVVKKERWTFDLDKCVVCASPDCKKKQKEIVNSMMAEIIDKTLKGMMNNDQ